MGMRRHDRWLQRTTLPLLALALALCGWVQPSQAQTSVTTSAGDPPDRVARVSYVAGETGLLPDGDTRWRDVDINRPLTTGDRLSTGTDARLELEFGDATLRMAGDTAFGFLELGDWQTRGSLNRGTVQLNVRTVPDGESYEIDTPQVAMVVDRSARVRVDVGDGDATAITVREGTVVVHGEAGARRIVRAGEQYRFDDALLSDAVAVTTNNEDAFYRWCRSRDALYADTGNGHHVAEGTVGYRDLDRYGRWQSVAGYDQVWFPNDVDAGWAPYRNGHWAWIAPWGWTWISSAPWGFAPFHYGRWQTFGGRWGWIPGTSGVRAVYAPALVAFVGGGNWQVSISVGGAPVGWYPLAPGMVYNPWYDASRRYYWHVNRGARHRRHHHDWKHRVNAAYNVWRKPERLRQVHYLGSKRPHGVTVVSHEVLAEGRSVRKARRSVDDHSIRHAPVRLHGLKVRPQAGSHRVLRDAVVHRLPVKGFDRTVVAARHRVPKMSRAAQRATYTPWRSPVRVLDHDRHPGGSRYRISHPEALQPTHVAGRAPMHRRVVPTSATSRLRHLGRRSLHRADTAGTHLPAVPRLNAAGGTHHAEPTLPRIHHVRSAPTPSVPVTRRPDLFRPHPMQAVHRATLGRTARERRHVSQPHAPPARVLRRNTPRARPVRMHRAPKAMSRPATPHVRHRSHSRAQPVKPHPYRMHKRKSKKKH